MTSNTQVSTEQVGRRSPVTQQLIQRLRDLCVGEFISYGELSAIANCDITGKYRHYLSTAVSAVESEYSVVVVCKPKEGFVRLRNEEIAKHANTLHRKRLASDTQRYRSKVECIDSSRLTLTQRIEHGLALAQIGLREMTTDKPFEQETRKRLAQSPENRLNIDALLSDMRSFR